MSLLPCIIRNGGFTPFICPIGLAFSAFSFDAVMGAPAKFLNAGPLIIKASVTAGER